MLYDTYTCNIKEVKIHTDEESYEIPGYDGARISKEAPPGKMIWSRYGVVTTLIEMVERGCRVSDNGPCVGWRSSESEYSWYTYKEFMTRAMNFSSGMIKLGIQLDQSNCICIYGQNSIQWVIAQYGCYYQSSFVAPLYDTIGPDARTYMINKVESQVVICDSESRVKALLESSSETPSLKYIIFMHDIRNETKQLGKEKGICLYSFKEVEELGLLHKVPPKLPKSSDVALICFTSGTTGQPKGVILTHKNILSGINGAMHLLGDKIPNKDDVSLSYLPLPHGFEQVIHVLLFLHGGRIGYFSGDLTKLMDDIRVLKPTIFPAVPRVLNKIYEKIEATIKMLRMKAELSRKESSGNNETSESKQDDMFKPILQGFGGRIRYVISSSAPIADKVVNFCRKILNTEVIECYGLTECSGPAAVNVINDETIGCIGAPLACCMIKLVDVPELEYFKENSFGEVCIKGSNVFQGYHNDPEKTEEVLDEDEWLHSGDIGMWLPNGMLKIVDRKKNIFKLAQGEYIVPEKIENIYLSSPFISQILVHGDSLKHFLVAIIVPDKDAVMSWCKENSVQGTWVEICKNSVVKNQIVADMQRVAKSAGLLSFQQVKEIYLHPQLLTVEEGYITPTQKLKKEVVRKLFANELKALYSQNVCMD